MRAEIAGKTRGTSQLEESRLVTSSIICRLFASSRIVSSRASKACRAFSGSLFSKLNAPFRGDSQRHIRGDQLRNESINATAAEKVAFEEGEIAAREPQRKGLQRRQFLCAPEGRRRRPIELQSNRPRRPFRRD